MDKVSKGMSRRHKTDSLRHNTDFFQPFVNSVYRGTESISCLGPKIRSMFPDI